jgi:hypothetical protein
MWRGGQGQKIGQENPRSNTNDENEPSDAEAVTLSRLVMSRFYYRLHFVIGFLSAHTNEGA